MHEKSLLKQNILTTSMEQSPFWKAKNWTGSQEIPAYYGGLLPFTQDCTTGLYLEPNGSNQQSHIPFPRNKF